MIFFDFFRIWKFSRRFRKYWNIENDTFLGIVHAIGPRSNCLVVPLAAFYPDRLVLAHFWRCFVLRGREYRLQGSLRGPLWLHFHCPSNIRQFLSLNYLTPSRIIPTWISKILSRFLLLIPSASFAVLFGKDRQRFPPISLFHYSDEYYFERKRDSSSSPHGCNW